MNSKPLITFDKLVTKMAIMLRNVHGAAKKIKEVDSTALAWQKAKEKAREPRKAPRSQKAKAQRARARAARAPRGPHVQSVGAGGSSLSMALFTASSSCDRPRATDVSRAPCDRFCCIARTAHLTSVWYQLPRDGMANMKVLGLYAETRHESYKLQSMTINSETR